MHTAHNSSSGTGPQLLLQVAAATAGPDAIAAVADVQSTSTSCLLLLLLYV